MSATPTRFSGRRPWPAGPVSRPTESSLPSAISDAAGIERAALAPPKDYARPTIDRRRLGRLINMIADTGMGRRDARWRDLPDHVYECFMSRFAGTEGARPDASLEEPRFGDDL